MDKKKASRSMVGRLGATQQTVSVEPTNQESCDVDDKRDIDPKFLIPSAEVQEGPPLGEGNFAVAHKGTYKGKNVALKKGLSEHETLDMKREALIMSLLGVHPNVIFFYGMTSDPTRIVMENCTHGPLDDILGKAKAEVKPDELVTYLTEISSGMMYLVEHGCIHRDLAARNILVSDDGLMKISDFGLSSHRLCPELETFTGTKLNFNIPLRWWPPECLRRNPKFLPAMDVWSFGVVVYEVFSQGERPWPDVDPKKVATNIRHMKMFKYPKDCPRLLSVICRKRILVPLGQRWDFTLLAKVMSNLCADMNPSKKYLRDQFGPKVEPPKLERIKLSPVEQKDLDDLCRKNVRTTGGQNAPSVPGAVARSSTTNTSPASTTPTSESASYSRQLTKKPRTAGLKKKNTSVSVAQTITTTKTSETTSENVDDKKKQKVTLQDIIQSERLPVDETKENKSKMGIP
ncbi:unnamed protein product [Bursaphelenchus okinawaensis]|uniref:Protein kinase domain-containing protein n=1 Tax=Bursaphelenchus okinawaensis TaxID=465554 RepID=A0A811LMD2_9BILA|nr:unnamed protein product [Bursaphelenchus okinawaensis]CAG9124290.1 unnamed protein product [Bursaphelenchus okinawaensis]